MTSNSTESQPSNATQNPWDAIAKMVSDAIAEIKNLPRWAQFGAFFLVVALVANIATTYSLSSDRSKLLLTFAFFGLFTLFVLFLYALNAHQEKLLKRAANVEEATRDLEIETNKRINQLEGIQRKLQEIENQSSELPYTEQTKLLKENVSTLLNYVTEDLETVDSYRKKLATGSEIETRIQSPNIYYEIADEIENSIKQTED